jgi:hypothetical protein
MSFARTLVAALFSLTMWGGASLAQTAEPAILTIAGKIGQANRGPLDEFRDAFLYHKDVKFEKAHAFTRAALAALPQKTITTRAEDWPAAVSLTGPSLADALAAAGVAADATVTATALDGYNVELSPEERAAHDWVLAISADGAPLSIGGRGPVWMLYGTGNETVSVDDEMRWVWAVYLIEVK